MTTKEKINQAFRRLRKAGYIAKQNFWCCQSCAWNAISNDYPSVDKVVFYHNQDADCIEKNGSLNHPLYLAWMGDSNEICKILLNCGLQVEHDGSEDSRIKVLPEEKQ